MADLAEKFEKAGASHDQGKARELWQRAFGGSRQNPIAKSKAVVNAAILNGYRHEFGSLIDASRQPDHDDLVLHLIASHAGARPFFTRRQFDRESLIESKALATETARRYSRLQHLYGPWGLAYLEAIFKCADGIVSSEEGGGVSD